MIDFLKTWWSKERWSLFIALPGPKSCVFSDMFDHAVGSNLIPLKYVSATAVVVQFMNPSQRSHPEPTPPLVVSCSSETTASPKVETSCQVWQGQSAATKNSGKVEV